LGRGQETTPQRRQETTPQRRQETKPQRLEKIEPGNTAHPLHPWIVLADPKKNLKPEQFNRQRQELVQPLRTQTAQAEESGRQAIMFEDFRKPTYQDWFVTGEAFGAGPSQTADVLLASDLRRPIAGVVGAGLAHSCLASSQ